MLGVGGSVRQAEKGTWCVELQGARQLRMWVKEGEGRPKEQIARVTKALLDFQCLRGLSSSSLEALNEMVAFSL